MSYPMLPIDNEDLFQGLPSFNRIENTLLLIETIKILPNHSLTCLDPHDPICPPLEEDDSLRIQVQINQQPTDESSDLKKKKTGCTCKKTNCLKRYCECFSSGKVCTPDCACYGCHNHHDHEEFIELANRAKNPRKAHRGCTCKKSQCQKKYCECFNAGIACTAACKCKQCENHGPECEGSCGEEEKVGRIEEKEVKLNLGQIKMGCPKSLDSFSNLGLISGFDL